MGRATRWLRGLFGGKKPDADGTAPAKEKRRWGFAMPLREKAQQRWRGAQAAASTVVGTEERKGSYREAFAAAAEEDEDEEERQSKHAIAVAAATAAVAEAAVAAAQAAAVVVRLTSSGRAPAGVSPIAVRKREEAAAIKIQATFRGYLARRALKALRGLVKLQALVRGNIVRKQAAETLRCMQALVRVQARARACRVLRSERCRFEKAPTCHVRASSRPATSDSNIRDRINSGGLNWLERWMEERYWDSRGPVNAKRSGNGGPVDDEKNAKILEVDPGKPQFHHKRRNAHNHSSCSTLTSDPNSHSFLTVPDSPSMESTAAQHFVPSQTSVEMQQSLSHLRFPFESGGYGESPQFYSASSRPGSSRRGAFTPAKSECSGSLFSGYSDYPNYMANTESSRAKVRSHSAPKQRPDRQNPTGPLAQRSSSLYAKFSHKAYPGSGRLDRLGMPIGDLMKNQVQEALHS